MATAPALGQTAALIAAAERVSLVHQFKAIGLGTRRVGLIGTNPDRFDHVGQAANFPGAKLLIVSELPSPAIESA